MGVIGWYVLFALTTAIVAYYELIGPTIFQLEIIEPENNLIRYKFITMIIVVVSNFVIAPLIILPCLVPSMGTRFRAALLNSLLEGKKI